MRDRFRSFSRYSTANPETEGREILEHHQIKKIIIAYGDHLCKNEEIKIRFITATIRFKKKMEIIYRLIRKIILEQKCVIPSHILIQV